MTLVPYVTYPGMTADNLVRFSGSAGDGAEPGRFVITLDRSVSVAATGTLTFGDGEREIVIPGCRVVDARLAGPNFEITIEDRRWRWQFGGVYGRYNVPDGGVRKTASELVELLWGELQETGLDVTLLQRDSHPEVEWDGDNPAEALVAIVDELGCTLAPSLDGSWKIWPQGFGDVFTAPGYETLPSLTQPVIAAPDAIRAFSGPIQYEACFELEAVGEDIDGTIKPIDDLSYAPAWGWEKQDDDFADLEGTYTKGLRELNIRDLAKSCIRRWYRAKSMPSGMGANSFDPPGYPTGAPPVEFDQTGGGFLTNMRLLPVVNEYGNNKAYDYRADAEVWGVYQQDPMTGANTRPGTPVAESFSIDSDKWIVRFGSPVHQNSADLSELLPASLYLRCVVEIDDVATGYPVSYAVNVPTGLNNGTGAEPISKPKLKVRWQPEWNSDGTAQLPSGSDSHRSTLQSVAVLLQAAALERMAAYQTQAGGTQSFVGFHAPQINGRVTNVAWSYSTGKEATTTIGVSTSANKFIRPDRRKERYRYRGTRSASELKAERQKRLLPRGLIR